jgi:hypothetical protein
MKENSIQFSVRIMRRIESRNVKRRRNSYSSEWEREIRTVIVVNESSQTCDVVKKTRRNIIRLKYFFNTLISARRDLIIETREKNERAKH